MTNRDTTPLISLRDVPAALGLLTRLPIGVNTEVSIRRGAVAAWAYPIAGLVIGTILAIFASITLWLGLPAPLAAALTLAVSVILTGAMHEDGLADSADGLWGGWDKARRLEIMKDSHIGVYGVLALALSLLIRWLALAPFIALGLHWPVLIATAMLSRANMTAIMAALPNARDTGLSQSVGRPSRITAIIAGALAVMVTFFGFGIWTLPLAVLACATALICGLIAHTKIGGQTGDILGATQQMTEIVVLLTLVVLIS